MKIPDLPAEFKLPMAKIHAQHFARTAIDWNQPKQRANHRRFARAIGPEQTDSADRDSHRKIIERPDATVRFRNAYKLEQRRCHDELV